MPVLQDLISRQIDEALGEAIAKLAPVAVTVSSAAGWLNLRSRMLARQDVHLHLELPLADGAAPHEFTPAEKIGLSFKIKHHKHIFTVTVAGVGQFRLDDGTEIPTLVVCCPSRMQRLQRRAYKRAAVPPNRIVRASFWLGGRQNEPAGTSVQAPVWSGTVTDLSAGGFRVVVDANVADAVEIGDAVGIRLAFGAARETVYADAQFRHAEFSDGHALLGFQFVALGQSTEGCRALDMISAKVAEYHRSVERAVSHREHGASV